MEQTKMIKLPKNEGLNIVPFIDVMLVLLAIVLSISTFIAYGHIKIEPPKSAVAQTAGDNKEKILISIDAQDIFYCNDKMMSFEELEAKISSLDNTKLVELKADKNCKFDSFIKLVTLLKAKNHDNFQIITQK